MNSTASPPGSAWGQRCDASFFALSSVVSGCGSPPDADTLNRPLSGDAANTIVLSGSQVAPRARLTLQIEREVPPVTGTLRSSPDVAYPIHVPSGEKNGW